MTIEGDTCARFVNRFIFIQLLAFYRCGYVFAVFPLFSFFHTRSFPFSIKRFTFFSVSGPQAKKKHRDKEREIDKLFSRATNTRLNSFDFGRLFIIATYDFVVAVGSCDNKFLFV